MDHPIAFAAALFVAALAGALLPLIRRWSERGLHGLLAVSAGIFLGMIFLHFLPELGGAAAANTGHDHAGHGGHAGHSHAEHALSGPWIAALIGFLALFLVEKVWLANRSEVAPRPGASRDPHLVLWTATLVGLSIHALITGLALSGLPGGGGGLTVFLVTFCVHKLTEGFSLSTVMQLAHLSKRRMLAWTTAFAAITPVAFLVGGALGEGQAGLTGLLAGFAAGTFLYVAVCDLLPEVFHGAGRPLPKVLLLLVGIGISILGQIPPADVLEFVERVGRESLVVFVEMSPFLLLGFLIAGFIHVVLKPEWVTKRMAGDDTKSVAFASILGAPMPLCSCSVIPVAVSMRKAGASKGATSSFLIATPETGVDSVSVTWGLLDPVLTVARPIGAVLSAMLSGSCVNWLVRRGWDRDREPEASASPPPEVKSCCSAPEPEPPKSCCSSSRDESAQEHDHSVAPKSAKTAKSEQSVVARALRYSFIDMLDDLAGPLLIGIAISGVLAAAIPAAVFEAPISQGFGGLLLMLLVGIPIYVCAAASTPIAATLILKGMSPGAALVFLLASPATNLGSLVVLSRVLGKRVVLVSTLSLALSTLALGWTVDRLYPLLGMTPSAKLGAAHHEHLSWFAVACAVLLGASMLAAIVRGWTQKSAPDESLSGASTVA